MNQVELLENGFLLLKEDEALHSPLSVLNYEFYDSIQKVTERLENETESIQCVVGSQFVPFGKAQCPEVYDYADGVDTLEFLLTIK